MKLAGSGATSSDNGESSPRVVDVSPLRAVRAFYPREIAGTSVASCPVMPKDDLGYVYIEYLVVLGTVGILSAIGMLALLPTIYTNCFDSVSVLLSIKP
jgi:hypothetical protein